MTENRRKNGGVTLALLGQNLDRLIADVSKVQGTVDELHSKSIEQSAFQESVKLQLWDHNGVSRIQTACELARNSMAWVKIALIPIALLAIGAIIKLCL